MSGIGDALLVPAYNDHYASRGGALPPLTLDTITVPALIALSLYRKLRNAHAGAAIRVRRTDTTELDIGFVAGLLDTAGLLTFVGAGTGTVTTVYDQGPSGRNLTQANPALQPIIVNAGALVITTGPGSTGKPTMTLGTSRTLERADACGLTGAPAITLGARFRDGGGGGYPTFARLGTSGFGATGGLFSLTANSGVSNSMYAETIGNGQSFVAGPGTDSRSYVAQAAAGAPVSAYTLRSNGAPCTGNGFGGSSAGVMALTNQRTAMGGGNGTGAGVYRDATGDENILMIFNAVLTGADLTAFETELMAHA